MEKYLIKNKMKKVEIIIYNGVELTVVGTYTEREDSIPYSLDGVGGYPGINSDFEIHNIIVGGYDIKNIFYTNQLDDIIELVINEIER